MDQVQTADFLSVASKLDRVRRDIDEVRMWAVVLRDVTPDDALWALQQHHQSDHALDFLKPGHITAQLKLRRATAALRPAETPECDIHPGYPLTAGSCAQCKRYPEDRRHFQITGERPAMLPITEIGTVGHLVPESQGSGS